MAIPVCTSHEVTCHNFSIATEHNYDTDFSDSRFHIFSQLWEGGSVLILGCKLMFSAVVFVYGNLILIFILKKENTLY